MRFGKVLFVFLFVFACLGVHAQQIKILNNYGEIPFEDGKTIIAEVIFIGLDSASAQTDEIAEISLTETEVLRILSDNQTTINAGETFYGYKVAKTVKAIREWLPTKGYDRAEVVAFGEQLPKSQMKLTFFIKRGDLARVSEIRFEGIKNVSNEELVADFRKCSGNSWEIFDGRKFLYYLRQCSLRLLFSKGYFQAKIGEPKLQLVSVGYIVTINISEGARFRYGKLKVQGASVFTEEEILDFIGIKKGEVANGKTLQVLIYENLKRIYADKGYISYDAEFQPTFNVPKKEGEDATVDLEFLIDEGRQFNLGKIEFGGVEKEKADELRRFFLIADGEIYNQSKIEEGLNKINELRAFQPIDFDTDVSIRSKREEEQKSENSIIVEKEGVILRQRNYDET
ncbi:MAG TPA: POTRA domain-containing protein, partial [Pyrinomonadaceae bacterium]|nr:POTRA domain-containing protein [Pyrinomonadaceae bacterium]